LMQMLYQVLNLNLRNFASTMLKRFASPLPILLLVISACSCRSVQFYKESEGPFYYSGLDSFTTKPYSDSLNVVTFNIKKAEKIDLAIAELQQFEQTRNVDVYLLQEMTETGAEAIAKAMHMNYLYIPIVYDRADQKNIGNAILTRGTITHPEKLILPHAKWQNQQRRDVTIGEVNIHHKKILVYSVHTETFAMSKDKRMDQVDAIIKHAQQQSLNYQYVLIGGDFNTLFPKDGDWVVDKFTGNGFDWSTAAVGSTARAMYGLVKPRHDYLFSRGLKVASAGRIENHLHFRIQTGSTAGCNLLDS
jgi:endonuclease/exonuclease/phosphatase family metal-dependent hydrolase